MKFLFTIMTRQMTKDKTIFELYSEICIMNQEHFFIRGCAEIPVLNEEEFSLGNIWVSFSEENFRRMTDLWESDKRENEPP